MAFVQASSPVVSSGTPASAVLSLTGVTAGNAIVVGIIQVPSATTSYSASDAVDGAFGNVVENDNGGSSRIAKILVLHGVTAGSHTITCAAGGGTTEFIAIAIEVSNLDSLASPITATYTDPSSTNTHYCAASGSIDTSGACFVLCLSSYTTAGVSTTSAGGTYTEIDLTAVRWFLQYKDAASALTDDRGEWASTGTARTGVSCMAAFPEASGALSLSGSSAVSTWTVPAGTFATQVALTGTSAVATWTVPTNTLTVIGTVALTGDSAVSTWAVPAGTFVTHVALDGATATAAWAVPSGTFATRVALSGSSASAAWAAAGDSLSTHVGLTGASATASWAVPAGTFATQVTLSGASAAATWMVPAGTLGVHVDLTGSSAIATWAVTAATLTTDLVVTYDSIRVGTVRSGQAGASAVRSGQSGASAVRSGEAGASAVRSAYD